MENAAVDSRTKVLVVEPDTVISLYVRQVLEDAGFRVFEAASANEAMAALAAVPEIAVVVTASDKGGVDGVKLAAQVANGWPPVRVVVTSGDRLIDPDDLPAQSRFIAKPYSEAELLATLKLLEQQWLSRLM